MGLIESWAIGSIASWASGIVGAWLLAFILKKIPNKKIKLIVGKFAFGLGVTITLGLAKWKFTKGFWNKTIEPFFIDLVDNVIGEFVSQFIKGLRSDN